MFVIRVVNKYLLGKVQGLLPVLYGMYATVEQLITYGMHAGYTHVLYIVHHKLVVRRSYKMHVYRVCGTLTRV